MNMPSNQHATSRAERLYRLLLFAYPGKFRRLYGQQMRQTFRDCYRDALQQERPFNLAQLWGFVLYDLATTAFSEHVKASIAHLKRLTHLEKEYLMSSLLNLDVASSTDIGRTRAVNEDNLASVVPQDIQIMAKKGALFVVADGMGGHTRGDVASEMAVNIVRDTYYKDENNDIPTSLRHALEQANTLICQSNDEQSKGDDKMNMGTICVAAVLKDAMVYIANAGDSLAYIVRNGQVRQITQDHSWVAEQVRTGAMSEAEAKAQGKDNVITRCLGSTPDTEVYVGSEQVQNHDTLVLCTDGLHTLVSEDEIRTTIEQYGAEESASRLIALANENGGRDNITVVVVRISLTESD